jgi:hypothetical protein
LEKSVDPHGHAARWTVVALRMNFQIGCYYKQHPVWSPDRTPETVQDCEATPSAGTSYTSDADGNTNAVK